VELSLQLIEQLGEAPADTARSQLAELRILDPTCGAGAFLLEAARVLHVVGVALGLPNAWWAACLYGIDTSQQAVDACRTSLALLALELTGDPIVASTVLTSAHSTIVCADALDPAAWPATHAAGFDAVIGNPPYVRAPGDFAAAAPATAACGNLYAWVVERALDRLAPGGRVGIIVPVSSVCADRFEPWRQLWRDRCAAVHVSSYDTIPSTLFPGTVQRLAIWLGRRRDATDTAPDQWHVTRYHKWRAAERDRLFDDVRYVPLPPQSVRGSLAKVGTDIERDILDVLFTHAPARDLFDRTGSGHNRFFYKRRWSYFLLFTNFMPDIFNADGSARAPSEFKSVDVTPDLDARVLLALYNSTLFHWYFTVFSDNRNVNQRDLAAFPFDRPTDEVARSLASLADELMQALRASSELRECTYKSIGTIRNTYFRQAATLPVIDRIDQVLARHYGFDERQLAFIQGFDREYRAGT
jgi:hypothetical protein